MEHRTKLYVRDLDTELQLATNGSEVRKDRTGFERDSTSFYKKGKAGTSLCFRFHIMATIREKRNHAIRLTDQKLNRIPIRRLWGAISIPTGIPYTCNRRSNGWRYR
jgi:hypothetical protein